MPLAFVFLHQKVSAKSVLGCILIGAGNRKTEQKEQHQARKPRLVLNHFRILSKNL